MPRPIVCFEARGTKLFGEWSTIVDAPLSSLMSRERFVEWYLVTCGRDGTGDLPERLARAESVGTSLLSGTTLDDLLVCNRAGPNERPLTKAQIIKKYGPPRPKRKARKKGNGR